MAEPTSASVAHGLAFPPVSAKTGATIERPIRTPAMKLAACQGLARGLFMLHSIPTKDHRKPRDGLYAGVPSRSLMPVVGGR